MKIDRRVDFRNGRYFIKKTNIRVDLVIGLGVSEVVKMYPWLSEKQVSDALEFAADVIMKKGKSEEKLERQLQTAQKTHPLSGRGFSSDFS